MFARLLLIGVLALPLVEIALFVLVGQAIGLWATLAAVILIGLAGALVLRWQGVAVLGEMQRRMRQGELPARQMGDTMLIGLAGLFLLIPGFFSDIVGLLLLIPFTRRLIWRMLARNFRVVEITPDGYRRQQQPGMIELDESDWRDRPTL